MSDEKLVGEVPTIDERVVRLERVSDIWAFVVQHPAEKTAAGSLVPASETLIRISTPDTGTNTLVSALPDGELDFFRKLACAFSKHTGLKVTLRKFREVIDEEVIEDGRARSLNRVVKTSRGLTYSAMGEMYQEFLDRC